MEEMEEDKGNDKDKEEDHKPFPFSAWIRIARRVLIWRESESERERASRRDAGSGA